MRLSAQPRAHQGLQTGTGPAGAADTGPMISTPSARPRVLCIDDSLLIRKTIAMTLGAGVELLSAATAREGLTLAAQAQPVLIITDIHMPGMDGFEMLAALKADPRTAHIPVVALTSASGVAQKERGLQAGFVEYVPKTADLSALMRLVAHHSRPAAAA